MSAWIKRGALICCLFIAVWILMVVYWSSTNRMPTSSEILLYLLVLPIAFLLAVWLTRKIGAAIAAGIAARAAAAAAPPELPQTEQPAANNAERQWTLTIAASALRSPHGASAAELSAALQSKEARLALDAALTDADGFPIRTGRIAAADAAIENDEAPIAAWLAAGGQPEIAWTEEQLRALALGAEVLAELASQLQLHPRLPDYLGANAATREAATSPLVTMLPTLQLISVLPRHWPAAARKHGADWFAHLLAQGGWPAEKIQLDPHSAGEQAEAAAPLKLIDDLSIAAHRPSQQSPHSQPSPPCLSLLIACESFIGERSVTEWDQAGQLLKGKGNSGQTPAEGAVGFIIADRQQAALIQADAALTATLHRVAQGRRDKSADAAGRIDGAFVSVLAQDALRDAGVAADDIALLIADSDHRGSRTEELMGLGYAVLPEIDLGSQCLKIAADCGSAGAVSCLTALALAHHAASSAQAAVLCISNNDAFDRAAVVVSPYRPTPDPELSPVPAASPTAA